MQETKIERRRNFNTIYKQEIAPFMRSFEKTRQKECLNAIFCFIALIISIICTPPLIFLTCWNGGFIILVLIFAFVIYFSHKMQKKIEKDFLQKLKDNCEQKILNLFGDIKRVNGCFYKHEIVETTLFDYFDTIKEDDAYVLTHKGVNCKVADIELLHKSKSDGKSNPEFDYTEAHVFDGILIKIDSNKTFKGKTIISRKGAKIQSSMSKIPSIILMIISFAIISFLLFTHQEINQKILPTLILFFIILIISTFFLILSYIKPQQAFLEDAELMKYYEIETTDQIESRFLITPAFMQRFKRLQTVFGKTKIRCAFYNNSIFLAIETKKNLFEFGSVYKPITSKDSINDFYNQIEAIYNIIEHFKFDEKIY